MKAINLKDVLVGDLFIAESRAHYSFGTVVTEDLCEKISDALYVKVVTASGCEDNTRYYTSNYKTVWI